MDVKLSSKAKSEYEKLQAKLKQVIESDRVREPKLTEDERLKVAELDEIYNRYAPRALELECVLNVKESRLREISQNSVEMVVNGALARERGRFYEIAAVERGDGRLPLTHPGLSPEDVLAVGPILLRSGGAGVRALWEERQRRLDRIVETGARGPMAERAARAAAQARRILTWLGG